MASLVADGPCAVAGWWRMASLMARGLQAAVAWWLRWPAAGDGWSLVGGGTRCRGGQLAAKRPGGESVGSGLGSWAAWLARVRHISGGGH
jgi:hypothetical protein